MSRFTQKFKTGNPFHLISYFDFADRMFVRRGRDVFNYQH